MQPNDDAGAGPETGGSFVADITARMSCPQNLTNGSATIALRISTDDDTSHISVQSDSLYEKTIPPECLIGNRECASSIANYGL